MTHKPKWAQFLFTKKKNMQNMDKINHGHIYSRNIYKKNGRLSKLHILSGQSHYLPPDMNLDSGVEYL